MRTAHSLCHMVSSTKTSVNLDRHAVLSLRWLWAHLPTTGLPGIRRLSFSALKLSALKLSVLSFLMIGPADCLGQAGGSIDPATSPLLVSTSHSAAIRPAPPARTLPPVLPKELAEVEIALGRLRLVPDRFRIVRKHEASTAEGFERTVQIAAVDGRPTVRLSYQDSDEKWSLTIDAIAGAQWSREFQMDDAPVTVTYAQPPGQSITIDVLQRGSKPSRLVGSTLWHLTERNSVEFQKYVLPSLKRLNGNWDLPGSLAAAKRMRHQCDGVMEVSCGEALQRCVTELESTDHSVRAAAIEQLRTAGLAAQIPLERMTHQSLTTQQRSSINQLLAELEPRTADTPTRLAYWLSGDSNWR